MSIGAAVMSKPLARLVNVDGVGTLRFAHPTIA